MLKGVWNCPTPPWGGRSTRLRGTRRIRELRAALGVWLTYFQFSQFTQTHTNTHKHIAHVIPRAKALTPQPREYIVLVNCWLPIPWRKLAASLSAVHPPCVAEEAQAHRRLHEERAVALAERLRPQLKWRWGR